MIRSKSQRLLGGERSRAWFAGVVVRAIETGARPSAGNAKAGVGKAHGWSPVAGRYRS